MTQGKWWRGAGRVENSREQDGQWWLDWYFKQDIFIPSCRREWSSPIRYGRRLRDPAGAVRLTGPSPVQPAVHPLSRLDRPAVTHSAVKPWAEGFEMWQHNQFPWFMITLKGGRAERLGSWKRRAEGECWQQSPQPCIAVETPCFWLCNSCLLELPKYITMLWNFYATFMGKFSFH